MKFLPLLDILKRKQHQNSRIDYLKMDVEGAEVGGEGIFNALSSI